MAWPEAMTTGMRSGSGAAGGMGGVLAARGPRGTGAVSGRQATIAIPWRHRGRPGARRSETRGATGAARRRTSGRAGPGRRGGRDAAVCPTASCSGWPRPGSRSRAGSTARASRPTTGWPGSRSAGSSPRVTPSASGTAPRRPSTGPPPSGCDSFRLGVEWARVVPGRGAGRPGRPRPATWPSCEGCVDRGLEPLVTLHHFTHPAWLGEDLWLRPDAPARFRPLGGGGRRALAPSVRHWVTLNEINVLALGSYLLGDVPARAGPWPSSDAAVALDNLLCRPRARLRRHPRGPPRRRGHHQQLSA